MSSEQVASVLRQTSMQGQRVKFIVARPIQTSLNNIELTGGNKDDETVKTALREQLKQANNNINQANAIIIRTQEIMDKNIDLQSRIKLDLDKTDDANNRVEERDIIVIDTDDSTITKGLDETIKTTDIINDEFQPRISTPTPSNKSILIESSHKAHKNLDISTTSIEVHGEEEKISVKSLKKDEYVIELKRLENTTTSSLLSDNFIEKINIDLKVFGVQIDKDCNDKDQETFYVIDAPRDSPIEPYDYLIELNSSPVEQFQANYLNDKLNLKLCKSSFEFKSNKLKSKWFTQLKSDKYDIDEVNLEMCFVYDIQILVGLVDKTQSKNLGISLEGTVDVDDNGIETYPHHYIRSIMKNGPVDMSETKFQAGDELLEIDFFKLYAINYLNLLEILKGLKNKHVFMVCARKIKKEIPLPIIIDSLSSENKIGKIKAKSECFLSVESTNLTSTVLNAETEKMPSETIPFKSVENETKYVNFKKEETLIDTHFSQNNVVTNRSKSKLVISTPQMCVRSRSLELNSLSLWNTKIDFISLKKSEKGL